MNDQERGAWKDKEAFLYNELKLINEVLQSDEEMNHEFMCQAAQEKDYEALEFYLHKNMALRDLERIVGQLEINNGEDSRPKPKLVSIKSKEQS